MTSTDVTEHKRDEGLFFKNEERYRELVETMNEGLGVIDDNHIFTFVNQKLSDLLAYSKEELAGHDLTQFLTEDSQSLILEQTSNGKSIYTQPFEVAWVAKDGREVSTLISPKSIYDSRGRYRGSLIVITDISQRKTSEEKVRHEKNASNR